MRAATLLMMMLAVTVWPSTSALAATYRVGNGAGCTHSTIQAAINAAVAGAADDEIRITTASWTGQALSINAAQGAIALVGGFPGCGSSTPVTGARSVLYGNNTDPVLRINASNAVSMRSLDIQGGRSVDHGGGIRFTALAAATLSLDNTSVRNNNAVAGGGLSIENGNAVLAPAQVRVDIRGDSNVLGNRASGSGESMGGGIRCVRASVEISGSSHVSQNQAEAHGGGIYADDCVVAIGSSGVIGAVLWANEAGAFGGGAFLRGGLAAIDVFTVDAWRPARILSNRAWHGAGLSVHFGADARLFDVNIEGNVAESAASAAKISAGSGTDRSSTLLMQGGIEGAPARAVACADPEACNRITGNRSGYDTLQIDGDDALTLVASARLRGTRIEGNEGAVLFAVDSGRLTLDGTLVTGNTTTSTMISSSLSVVTLLASTIAGNTMRAGSRVVYGAGSCGNAQPGTRIERSIVWQPGHPLIDFDIDFPVQPDCFRHLIAADFGALTASPERVVVDPQFIDPGAGNHGLASGSPALDFAPASATETTRDRGPRVVELADAPNRFGPQDLGAYERITDRIFGHGFE